MSEHHRPLSVIDAERAEVAARVIELQVERDAARQAQIDTITRLFDDGLSLREIAREMRQTPAAVQGVLFRSGRSELGRIAIRHQITKAAARVPQTTTAEQATGTLSPVPVAALFDPDERTSHVKQHGEARDREIGKVCPEVGNVGRVYGNG